MASVFVIQRKNRKRRRIIELYFISIMKLINVLMTASVMDKEFALISNVKIRKIYLFKKWKKNHNSNRMRWIIKNYIFFFYLFCNCLFNCNWIVKQMTLD